MSPLQANVLAQAYAQCQKITKIFAKTFYLGTQLMSEEQQCAQSPMPSTRLVGSSLSLSCAW